MTFTEDDVKKYVTWLRSGDYDYMVHAACALLAISRENPLFLKNFIHELVIIFEISGSDLSRLGPLDDWRIRHCVQHISYALVNVADRQRELLMQYRDFFESVVKSETPYMRDELVRNNLKRVMSLLKYGKIFD